LFDMILLLVLGRGTATGLLLRWRMLLLVLGRGTAMGLLLSWRIGLKGSKYPNNHWKLTM
jgi:hypothetical protein